MIKTNKSLTKRLKVTKNGKIIARKPGQNHFNAKESRAVQMEEKSTKQIKMKNKLKSHLLPNINK